jgi:hypothetical protein
MPVRNDHARTLVAPLAAVGALLDTLASRGDRLWPHDDWPPMRLDRPLGVGAAGGHGPVRYVVEAYEPGRRVAFRFTAPRGFHGTHALRVDGEDGAVVLSHVLEMRISGPALVTWPLIFRPLHDALLEDALDRAQRHVGMTPAGARWSPWVSLLRRLMTMRRRRPQTTSIASP